MTHRILIIGIGSPVGDDRVGLIAAERLREAPAACAPVVVETADRPGVRLIDLWSRSDDVILVDAVQTGAVPGSVLRMTEERIASARSPWSSHGFGLAETVALARALDRLPARLVLFGVEIAAPPKGVALSPELSAALPGLIHQVRTEVARMDRERAAAR